MSIRPHPNYRNVATLSSKTQQRIQTQVREVVTSMSPASVGIELALAVRQCLSQ